MYGAIILSLNEISNMNTGKLMSSGRFLDDRFRAIKIITGYEFDNQSLYLSNIYGDYYSIYFHEEKPQHGSISYKKYSKMFNDNLSLSHVVCVSLWNQNGGIALFSKVFLVKSFIDKLPKDIIKQIEDVSENYSRDREVACSDCGIKIHHKTKEIGGHYFAGIYCVTCWLGSSGKHKDRGGWKAVEAKESYD